MQAKNKQGVARKRSRPNATVGCGFFYAICGGESHAERFCDVRGESARKGFAAVVKNFTRFAAADVVKFLTKRGEIW